MTIFAEVELKDGGKTVLLSSNNKTLEISAVVPKGVAQPVFSAEPAKPLPTSRIIKGEYPDYGKITRHALHFTEVKELRFAVSLRPGTSEAPSFVELDQWKAMDGKKSRIVTIEDEPVLSEIPLKPENINVTEGDAAALLDGDWTTVWAASTVSTARAT